MKGWRWPAARHLLRPRPRDIRHGERRAVLTSREHRRRLGIALAGVADRIEIQRPAGAVRDIGQVNQHRRVRTLLDLRELILALAAADDVDEIDEAADAGASFGLRAGRLFRSHERAPSAGAGCHVAFRPVPDVSDRVAGPAASTGLPIRSFADTRLVVRDTGPDFEYHHLPLAAVL